MKTALCVLLFLGLIGAGSAQDLVIVKSDRRVDLTTQFVRTTASLKVENVGSDPAKDVLFALSKEEAAKLAFVLASKRTKGQAGGTELVVTPSPNTDAALYNIALDKPLEPGQATTIDVLYVLTHALEPFPVEIKQSEPQLVLHHDNAYLLSPYKVKQQSTIFRVPSSRVESYTKVSPTKAVDRDVKIDNRVVGKEKEIKYGPYENIAPMTSSPITLHFENNSPFISVKVLERQVEISHWGNIYVTENFHIAHDGAKLKGGFSRLDYQSKPGSGISSVRFLEARIPPRVHSVYYRDEIGNISTSRLNFERVGTQVILEPRYPLFGGWQVPFTLGYGLSLKDFVFTSPDGRRSLNFSFGSPIVNAVVDKLILKIILPEGSSSPAVSIPFGVDVGYETKYSYLDTVGRPVIVLSKSNVVPEHNVLFQVHYKFNPLAMLAEPLMLVAGFFCFFVACIAYMRFDFPISKSSPSYLARLQREEVTDLLQRLQKVMKRRIHEEEKLETAMRDLARTGDFSACKAAKKAADPGMKESARELKEIADALHTRNAAISQKVESLVAKSKEKLDKLLQKLSVSVELYEKKASEKEIDSRAAPLEQRYGQLRKEVADALDALDI